MQIIVKQKALLFAFSLAFLFQPWGCSAAEDITVELVWKFPEPGLLEIEVRQGTYQLETNSSTSTLSTGESFKLGQSSLTAYISRQNSLEILEEPLIKLTTKDLGNFRVREPGKEWVSYRGNLTVTKENISWELANTLDREDYLKGVVPIEMSNSWAVQGFEALKAQAVAARTYLLRNVDSQGRITDSPDIHQAYWGKTVEGAASLAVEKTKGEILVDKDSRQPISIFYSAHNGGYSEVTEHVWKNHDPHYSSEPDVFSRGIGGYVDNWRFYIAADVLGKSFELAPIRAVRLNQYSSGRVYQVNLLDWLGEEKTVSGGAFVQKFYPYDRALSRDSFLGKLFQVSYIFSDTDSGQFQLGIPLNTESLKESMTAGPRLNLLKSSNEGLSTEPSTYGGFIFNGRGWGHGVGMSQWGAYNMARQGFTYDSILDHYYKKTMLWQSESS